MSSENLILGLWFCLPYFFPNHTIIETHFVFMPLRLKNIEEKLNEMNNGVYCTTLLRIFEYFSLQQIPLLSMTPCNTFFSDFSFYYPVFLDFSFWPFWINLFPLFWSLQSLQPNTWLLSCEYLSPYTKILVSYLRIFLQLVLALSFPHISHFLSCSVCVNFVNCSILFLSLSLRLFSTSLPSHKFIFKKVSSSFLPKKKASLDLGGWTLTFWNAFKTFFLFI